MKRVLVIPHEPGDVVAGKAFFAEECAPCHGRNGEGRVRRPPLAAQHIPYLNAQITSVLDGKRPHDDMNVLRAKTPTDGVNPWAFLSTLQD